MQDSYVKAAEVIPRLLKSPVALAGKWFFQLFRASVSDQENKRIEKEKKDVQKLFHGISWKNAYCRHRTCCKAGKRCSPDALWRYYCTGTATASKEPREGIDFFPLSVEYEEKMYAVGKIPGGFNKREGKASEHAILTSRVIDRPMRPLFPKDYRNDVTLVDMVMSVDPECNPEIPAMLGSSIATCISDIPFDGRMCNHTGWPD